MSDNKVNKEKFLSRVAKRAGISKSVVRKVYYAMIAEIEWIAQNEDKLTLTGFGTFYVQRHKGHPVQFGTRSTNVSDYLVFKFSASNVLNKRIRKMNEQLKS